MPSPTNGLKEALARQRDFVRKREPVYARLLDLLAAALPTLGPELDRAWQGRTFFASYDRPLLLLASLRNDALAEGPSHPLWPSIGKGGVEATGPTAAQLRAAVDASRERFWGALAERTVQTNETTRSVVWLWPASLIASVDSSTPLHVVDMGTSAGLNLVADDPALRMVWEDERGRPLDIGELPPIATRLGLDLSPLDVRRPEDARWLRACIWPSDTERLARLELAIEAFQRAASGPEGAPELEVCSAEGAPRRLGSVGEGDRLLVLQTLVRDYLSPEQERDYERGMTDLIAARAPGKALWVELEGEFEDTTPPPEESAMIRVHVADRDGTVRTSVLARTHPHPRKLFIDHDAVEEILGLL